jgi:hypothetical protein
MARDYAKEGNGVLALSGASQSLVLANASRQELTICNTSGANAMWLAFAEPPATPTGAAVAPTAAANTGLRLGPGQSYTTTSYRGPVAIFGTAADNVTFVEF